MRKLFIGLTVAALFVSVGTIDLLFAPKASNAAVYKVQPNMKQIKKFTSAADFKNYLKKNYNTQNYYNTGAVMRNMLAVPSAMEKGLALDQAVSGSASSPDRYSTTNVQVSGIDEPDIVKTDGQNIFYSTPSYYPYYRGVMPMRVMTDIYYPPEKQGGGTKIIKSWPADSLSVIGNVTTTGNLLLKDNVLVTFSGNTIYGYDVTDKTNPKQLWTAELGKKDSLVGARLYGGTIYLATEENIYSPRPCPYQPLSVNSKALMIPCGIIYHPVVDTPTDIIYNVISLDVKTGAVTNKTAFTGSSNGSQLYMSQNAIYVSYYNPGDSIRFGYNFLNANKDLVPSSVLQKIAQLQSYDISQSSKQNEFNIIMNNWQNDLSDDDRMKVQNEFTNRMQKYYPLHVRELGQTGVAKIGLSDLKVKAVGAIPGNILNQFSMDEYQNNLRIATTVGQGWWSLGWISASPSQSNDVYVLSDSMNTIGSVKDLGKDERIYSVRFIGDRGYMVTFKQTDPFFVLDLSNPTSPSVKGELKVPGYSGYLEPISGEVILGVGKEDNKVKAALYDVSDPNNPRELSKYILNEYWSDALNDHHAFLKDEKHKIFFIPGSQGGYVFSYENNDLKLVKTMSEYSVQRATYANDVLYIIGQNKISAYNENDWSSIKDLSL